MVPPMRMRGGIYRILRVLLIAAVAWLAFHWLEPEGLGWVVLAAAAAVMVGWIGLRALRIRRARARDDQADAWALALMHPPERPAAIRELTDERSATKDPAERARLTLVLAELLEANGDPRAALEALGELSDAELPPRLAAMVRHARAVALLSDGDPSAAQAALDSDPRSSGDPAIELRIRLMQGLIAAESGRGAEALAIARRSRDEALDDPDLTTEARVLEAVALRALGRTKHAIRVMLRLDDEMLDVLVLLGLPGVRALAADAIEARDAG